MSVEPPVGPIYVVGNSRSGTTVLSMGLGNHTDIFSFRELHFFEKYWTVDWDNKTNRESSALSILKKLICGQREGFLYCKDPEIYSDDAKLILDKIEKPEDPKLSSIYSGFLFDETVNNGKTIPCEQTPHNIFYLKKLFEFFPDAKIIAMIRDPRDILLSQKKKSKIKNTGKGKIPLKERFRTWSNYHPFIMSKMWNRVAMEINEWKNDPRVKVLKFEDLVSDPHNELSSICDFIGIEFQEKMLEVPQIGSSNVSDVSAKVGLNKNVLSKWKKGLSASEIVLCERINKQKLSEYGYELSNVKSNFISMTLLFLMLPVKGVLAVLLNIGRSKNIIRSITKRLFK